MVESVTASKRKVAVAYLLLSHYRKEKRRPLVNNSFFLCYVLPTSVKGIPIELGQIGQKLVISTNAELYFGKPIYTAGSVLDVIDPHVRSGSMLINT